MLHVHGKTLTYENRLERALQTDRYESGRKKWEVYISNLVHKLASTIMGGGEPKNGSGRNELDHKIEKFRRAEA